MNWRVILMKMVFLGAIYPALALVKGSLQTNPSFIKIIAKPETKMKAKTSFTEVEIQVGHQQMNSTGKIGKRIISVP